MKRPLKIDPNNPDFGALLLVLKEQHRALPESARLRWRQAILGAAARASADVLGGAQ